MDQMIRLTHTVHKNLMALITQVNSITNNALTGQTTSFSTSGTYTKTTQLIPIKIKLVNSDIPLENIIGTNATVNIKVK